MSEFNLEQTDISVHVGIGVAANNAWRMVIQGQLNQLVVDGLTLVGRNVPRHQIEITAHVRIVYDSYNFESRCWRLPRHLPQKQYRPAAYQS